MNIELVYLELLQIRFGVTIAPTYPTIKNEDLVDMKKMIFILILD